MSHPITYIPRLLESYRTNVMPALTKQFKYANRMQVPRLQKIVLNIGLGQQAKDAAHLEEALSTLAIISGQKPVTTRAKKSIANFHVRRGDVLGCRVTLRHIRMYEFFDRLVNATLPRIRDFRGVSARGFDRQGNFSMGLREHGIFPEIRFDAIKHTIGMDVTFVTTAPTREEAQELLAQLGMPFATTGSTA